MCGSRFLRTSVGSRSIRNTDDGEAVGRSPCVSGVALEKSVGVSGRGLEVLPGIRSGVPL